MKSAVWILAGLVLSAMAWAGEIWKDKQPAEWPEKQLARFLSKSPWAKTVTTQKDPRRVSSASRGDGTAINSAGSRGSGSAMPGMVGVGNDGGVGGRGGGGGMDGSLGVPNIGNNMPVATPGVTVRWESAPLVRAANARVETKEFNAAVAKYSKDYYVISVITVESMLEGRGSSPRDYSPQGEERRKQKRASLLEDTLLRRGDGKPITPERLELLDEFDGRVLFFLFPRSLALENGEKELNFETAFGPLFIRAKFNVKEMSQGSIQGL
jgi:hypothetical protein